MYDNDKHLADDFMNYFINKIKHIRSELGHFSKYKPHIDFSKGEVLEEFDTISTKELREIIGKLQNQHQVKMTQYRLNYLKDIYTYYCH